ncbi:hypothetical protein FRC15_003688 [Serendipita sp. 397]|nr:hypothetical protein FRC15_003688 [Serendipita sp. 397]
MQKIHGAARWSIARERSNEKTEELIMSGWKLTFDDSNARINAVMTLVLSAFAPNVIYKHIFIKNRRHANIVETLLLSGTFGDTTNRRGAARLGKPYAIV